MTAFTEEFEVSTRGKGTLEVTDRVGQLVEKSGVTTGIATVFVRHTSASLVIYENADPTARTDLHSYFERIAPEHEDWYRHTSEGPDDMPGHLRSVLTRTSEVIPISGGRLCLGTWQGIFLFEHRRSPHRRQIVVSVIGS